MNGSGATEIEILHELVHETTRKSENHELIRVVYTIQYHELIHEVPRFPAAFNLFPNSVTVMLKGTVLYCI